MTGGATLGDRLQQVGHDSSRTLVWRLGQAVAFAAIFHARAPDPALGREWHDRAVRLGRAIGAEPPALFPRQDDRREGSASALRYLLRTVGDAMGPPIARLGKDHGALFECAVKLCLVDFVGAGSKEMLAAISETVSDRARRAGLPESFQNRLARIVAEVGGEATKLIFEAYEEVFALLVAELAGAAEPVEAAAAASQPPSVARTAGAEAAPSEPLVTTAAEARLRIYKLGCTWSSATICGTAEPDESASFLTQARQHAAALGIDPSSLPPPGEGRRRLSPAALVSAVEQGARRIAALLRERHSAAQGAWLEAVASIIVWGEVLREGHTREADPLVDTLVARLFAAGLPSWLCGPFLALDVTQPRGKDLDRPYERGHRVVLGYLEQAARPSVPAEAKRQ